MSKYSTFGDITRAKKVVPFDLVRDVLERTEPVEQHVVSTTGEGNLRISMQDDWNYDMKNMDDSSVTSCKLYLGDTPYVVTKQAMLSLLRRIGISEKYALRTPGSLMEPHVNYWMNHAGVGAVGEESMLVVTKDPGLVVGVTSSKFPVISNLVVLNEVEEFVRDRGFADRVYVDPRIVNNYTLTDFRLIFDEVAFTVDTTRDSGKETDKWHLGVHISNALVSSESRPLTISGYMMEQKSLAGIIPEFSSLIGYHRSSAIDTADLRGWVRSTLDQIFDVMPVEAETIQDMPGYTFHGKVGVLTTDLFKSMKIHRSVQEAALENLMETGDMSSYGIMHAIARAVSVNADSRVAPKGVSYIQRVCGTLPARASEVCDSCGRLHLHD